MIALLGSSLPTQEQPLLKWALDLFIHWMFLGEKLALLKSRGNFYWLKSLNTLMEFLRGQISHIHITSVSEILTKPTAEKILETCWGISSKTTQAPKHSCKMAPISLPHIFHLFSPQEAEKQHRNFYAPSARSDPRVLRGGVRRQGIPWWVSPVTHQPQDVSSRERHYFRISYTGYFLWYISWG